MNLLGIALVLSSLLPIPAAVQDVGTVTFIEGSLRIIRGTTLLQAAEGMHLRQGDILESSDKGFAQLEFAGGAIVALGPSSRMYVFRHGAGGKVANGAAGTELVLLSGWLKGQSDAHAGSYRYESPALAATTGNGTVVVHTNENRCEIFVEAGSASIAEVSPNSFKRDSNRFTNQRVPRIRQRRNLGTGAILQSHGEKPARSDEAAQGLSATVCFALLGIANANHRADEAAGARLRFKEAGFRKKPGALGPFS
jgi:hypothetical protein